MKSFNLGIRQLSLGLSAVTLLIIFSFRDYFLYIPFQDGFSVFAFLGFTALVGWISLVVFPPVFFSDNKPWNSFKTILFFLAIGLYTASTLCVKIYSLATIGTFYANYLVLYPALFLIEWLVPGFYVFAFWRTRKIQNALTAQSRTS
jgi:hypothetical protein